MDMHLIFSPAVAKKLREKHGVTEKEVRECFENRGVGLFLIDTREDHKTDPPSQWFISETNHRKKLKVVFVFRKSNRSFHIKTAYEPNAEEILIYRNNRY